MTLGTQDGTGQTGFFDQNKEASLEVHLGKLTLDCSPPSKTPRWSDLLEIDWRPRSYEFAFLAFALVTAILMYNTPLPFSASFGAAFVTRMVKFIFIAYEIAFVILLVKMVITYHKEGPQALQKAETWISLLQPYFTLDFLMLSIRRGVAVLGSIYFFLHLKHVVLFINRSNYDLFYWNLDRWLHFGVQPNEYLMLKYGAEHNTALLLDWLYIYFFKYLRYAAILFLLDVKGRSLSEKFFLGYVLLWAVGGLGYLVAPADGPCYAMLGKYSTPPEAQKHIFQFPVTQDLSPEYIQTYAQSKIWKAKYEQQKLWLHRKQFLYREKLPGMLYGIAAMPSLHVGAVAFIVMFLWPISWLACIIATIFSCFIFVGSVFLQWHYAVDGYVGILLAGLCAYTGFKLGDWRIGGKKGDSGKEGKKETEILVMHDKSSGQNLNGNSVVH